MPTDNLGYTPGSGAKVATRDVTYSGEAAQVQVVGLATFAGADDAKTVQDIGEANPMPVAVYGELVEAIEAMRIAIHALTRSVGQAMPDTAGRLRVNVELGAITASIAASQTLANVTTVATLNSLVNQIQIGGLSATEQIPSLMRLGAGSIRRNITVS
jgi:hypothetical protein